MIYKHHSLVTAEAITNGVMNKINQDENLPVKIDDLRDMSVVIESYQNCREQGHMVWPLFKPGIAWYVCENRHTDAPTIYKGKYSMQSLSDEAYNNPKTCKSIEHAIEWLVEDILGEYLKHLQTTKG